MIVQRPPHAQHVGEYEPSTYRLCLTIYCVFTAVLYIMPPIRQVKCLRYNLMVVQVVINNDCGVFFGIHTNLITQLINCFENSKIRCLSSYMSQYCRKITEK